MHGKSNLLVCVTQQKTCERLIRQAAEMQEKLDGELHVLHVARVGWNFLDNNEEGEALEYLFKISKSVGANLTVLKSDNIVGSIIEYVNKNNISGIVIGEPPDKEKKRSVFYKLRNELKGAEIIIVPNE
ncbi:MAG: universal stress protein [Eubacteriales bacterium]|nr:universal stress protein [Eubacteriales bacterium]